MEIEKRTLTWIVIGVLFIFALYMVFKAGDASVASSVGSSAKIASQTASASSGMVGGC